MQPPSQPQAATPSDPAADADAQGRHTAGAHNGDSSHAHGHAHAPVPEEVLFGTDGDGVRLRRAQPGEEEALTDLVMRSVQGAWGYSDEFMAWEPDALVIHPEFLSEPTAVTAVLEAPTGDLIGIVVMRDNAPEAATAGVEMSRLMVAPEFAGQGHGRRLWEVAVAITQLRGGRVMTLDADPNAEPFYQRMGAVTLHELDIIPPMLPDWRVKAMRFDLPASSGA